MTLCREFTLVKEWRGKTFCKPLTCRSWGCEYCAPMRKRRLMAQAASGVPTRFLTLTINPTVGANPDERLQLLSHAWRTCVKRLRRQYGERNIEYLAIVEATKRGEPHLHILLRAPYIPQSLISSIMGELIDSPIVDIRRIKGSRQIIQYVAKYVTKSPHHFGTGKRYWSSYRWEIPTDPNPDREDYFATKWRLDHRHISNVARWLVLELGMIAHEEGGDLWIYGSSPPPIEL